MTEPAGIELPHDLTPDEVLAWIFTQGTAGRLGEWLAVIRSGLALGYSLDDMHRLHSKIRPQPLPADFGTMMVAVHQITQDCDARKPKITIRPGTIRAMVDRAKD